MSDGFLPFKGLAWGVAALAAGAAVMPATSSAGFDALIRTAIQTEPGRLKKRISSTPTSTARNSHSHSHSDTHSHADADAAACYQHDRGIP